MSICDMCGNTFDKYEAEYEFESEFSRLSYNNFKKCLCDECAIEVITNEVEGYYFEKCEKCGSEFDLIEEESKFYNSFPDYNGTELRDHWGNGIVCCDCAIEEIEDDEYNTY